MASIKFGSNEISTLKFGSNQVNKLYLGSTELWSNNSGYTVTLYADGDNPFAIYGSDIYDGTSASGQYLGKFDENGQEFTITSGNVYCISESLTSDDRYNGGTGSTGITITNWNAYAPAWLLASVTANGTLTIHEYQH